MAWLALGVAMLLGGKLAQEHTVVTDVAKSSAEAAIEHFKDKELKPEQIGVAVCEWNDHGVVASDDYRADQSMYPASVVKLFYLVYLSHLLDAGKLKKTAEIERAAHDMIVDSDNDATNWILEVITGAVSGPELGPRSLKQWMDRRQAVNRYFHANGYPDINACQKTWYSGPYGRERQGYGPNWEYKNALNPKDCERILIDIMADKAAKPQTCAWMRGFLSRAIPADSKDADDQSKTFSGKSLPSGTKLWSKAGWTSTVCHDVAAVQTKDGRRYAWAIFTKDHATLTDLVPFIAAEIVKRLKI